MELRQLRHFVALAEEGHFGRAAERVFVVQQALSSSIRNLEEEIGTPLVARTTRRVSLTPAGLAFLEGAREILRLAERSVERARLSARGELGQLRVGFVSGMVFGGLPEVIRTFRERHPQVVVELQELTALEQEAALRAQRIDLGLMLLPVREPALAHEALWQERLVVALPAGHALARRKRLTARDLADQDFVFFPRQLRATYFDQVMKLCADQGFQPRIVQEAIEIPTLLSLVAAGIGIFLPIAFFQRLGLSGVVYRPLADSPVVEIDAVWRRGDESPTVHAFLDVGREVLAARRAAQSTGASADEARRRTLKTP